MTISKVSRVPDRRLTLSRKQRALRDVVGDDVQHAAETFDERIGKRTFEGGRESGILGTAGGNRAADEVFGLFRLLPD